MKTIGNSILSKIPKWFEDNNLFLLNMRFMQKRKAPLECEANSPYEPYEYVRLLEVSSC